MVRNSAYLWTLNVESWRTKNAILECQKPRPDRYRVNTDLFEVEVENLLKSQNSSTLLWFYIRLYCILNMLFYGHFVLTFVQLQTLPADRDDPRGKHQSVPSGEKDSPKMSAMVKIHVHKIYINIYIYTDIRIYYNISIYAALHSYTISR